MSFEVPDFLCGFSGSCFDGEGVPVVFDEHYLRVAGRGLEGLEGFYILGDEHSSSSRWLVVDADPVDVGFFADPVGDGFDGIVFEFLQEGSVFVVPSEGEDVFVSVFFLELFEFLDEFGYAHCGPFLVFVDGVVVVEVFVGEAAPGEP